MKLNKRRGCFGLFTALAVLAACLLYSEAAYSGPVHAKEMTTTVTFEKKQYTVYQNESKKIKAVAANASGAAIGVTYKSGNTKIAKVDSEGYVTGIKPGNTVITAKADDGSGASASYKLVVKNERNGWHKTESGKRYYVVSDGKRAYGYTKIGKKYYYFNKKSYALINKWKYVKVDGTKYKLRFGDDGQQVQNVSSLIGKQKSYKIVVNTTKNIVVIYAKDGRRGYTIPVKAMVCSCGIKGHRTITGNYSSLRKAGKWHALYYGTYGKYCTRISGPYLFHSVVYSKYGDSYSLYANEYKKLGRYASHGCIRLSVKDAKWIYKNSSKCTVSLIKSDSMGPLLKPKAKAPVKVSGSRAYDPTDTDIKR